MGFPLPSGRLCEFATHATADGRPQAKFKIKVRYRTFEPVRMNSCFVPLNSNYHLEQLANLCSLSDRAHYLCWQR